jgi:hypothetical protein
MCVKWGVGGVGVDSWWGLSCRTMAYAGPTAHRKRTYTTLRKHEVQTNWVGATGE